MQEGGFGRVGLVCREGSRRYRRPRQGTQWTWVVSQQKRIKSSRSIAQQAESRARSSSKSRTLGSSSSQRDETRPTSAAQHSASVPAAAGHVTEHATQQARPGALQRSAAVHPPRPLETGFCARDDRMSPRGGDRDDMRHTSPAAACPTNSTRDEVSATRGASTATARVS